ncbi:sugar ABC transporter substrate-binding protein [Leucobacter viscericola]|uniref:Sugar ABC transporter substrate-binding protein n=1 Tax=Leucobacter viscericola TaxID=2714935 RepID=A0A6G7XG78_9MICO|nr:substrate-binding domain-containing protein [Leucobacter viscericola]QIK63476.1 sugar ABC transporter substrate-binding protein [Leucobacter viscericola]
MLKSRKTRWMRFGLATIAAGSALLLAACGSPAGKDTGDGGSSAPKTEKLKVALITHQAPGDTFWDIVRSGAENAADLNNIELLYSSDPDGARQAQLVQQAVDQKVDGIVVTLAKADAMSGEVKKAVDAGIPVFSINAGEDEYKAMGVLAHFGQNEFIAGQAVGEQLNKEGSKKAICVIQEQGHVGLEARCAGLKDTYKGQSEILYVNGQDMTSVASTITSKLQTNSDIDYVVTLGAPFAMTAVDAIKDAGSSAKLATTDLNADVYKALGDGSIVFASDQQPWLQGYSAVEAVRLYKEGGYVLGGGQAVLTGPSIITKDNLDTVSAQFKDAK